jgi:hypothetical protein
MTLGRRRTLCSVSFSMTGFRTLPEIRCSSVSRISDLRLLASQYRYGASSKSYAQRRR